MDWMQAVDTYCERTGPEYWSEPINAITNLSFIVAAVLGWREAKARGATDAGTRWLIAVVFTVGVGSYLFHTHAQVWAMLADVLPITVFILSYLALALRRFVGLGWIASLVITVAFLGASRAVPGLMDDSFADNALNGSEGYLPAFLALLMIGGVLRLRAHPAAPWLLSAAGIFAVSLTFRTIDLMVCDSFPLGTHFLWHLFNGALLGTLLFGMIRHGRVPAPLAPRATGG